MNKGLISLNAAMDSNAKRLSFDDIKDPGGMVYGPALTPESSEVPASTRAKLIDLYCLKKRCKEEVVMVQEEMARLESFYSAEVGRIDQICENLGSDSTDKRSDGLRCMLLTYRASVNLQLKSLGRCWDGFYAMSPLNVQTPVEQAQYFGANPTPPVRNENIDKDSDEYLEDVPSEAEDFDVDAEAEVDVDAEAEAEQGNDD